MSNLQSLADAPFLESQIIIEGKSSWVYSVLAVILYITLPLWDRPTQPGPVPSGWRPMRQHPLATTEQICKSQREQWERIHAEAVNKAAA